MFKMRRVDCDFIFRLLPIITKRNLILILSKLHRRVKEQIVAYGSISSMSHRECELTFGLLPLYRKRQLIWMLSEVASLIHRNRSELYPFEDLQMNDKRRLISSINCFTVLFQNRPVLDFDSFNLNDACNRAWNDLKPSAKSAIKRILGDVFKEVITDKDWYVVLLITRSRYINAIPNASEELK
jgi:hypothetical protein